MAPQADETGVSPVRLTGCLELVDEDRFRLKDAAGEDAPTSRSWKWGFLKKRPAPIDIVDNAGRLDLSAYVGQRVVATGILTDREMRLASLQAAAGRCG
jgi:hypothetical protein